MDFTHFLNEDWNSSTASKEEQKAIQLYTGSKFSEINRDLRSGKLGENKKTIKILDTIINNSSHDGILYRGIGLEKYSRQKQNKMLTPGTVIFDKAFSSFTTNIRVAFSYMLRDSKTHVVITAHGTKGCANLNEWSLFLGEDEILVARNMKMRIEKVEKKDEKLGGHHLQYYLVHARFLGFAK